MVIVGAGALGLALGVELARRGVETVIVDRGAPFERGESAQGASAGLVNPQARPGVEPEALRDLSLLSRHLFGDFVEALEEEAGLPCDYDVRGGLTAALTEAEEVALDRALDWQRARALRFEVLPGEEARAREPALSAAVRAAFAFPDDGQVSPARLARSLALAARRAGAAVLTHAPVSAVRVEAGRAAGVETPWGLLRADAVVNAAGAWACLLTGGPALPVLALRAPHALLDASEDPDRLSRFVAASGGALVPRRDGTLVLAGAGARTGLDGLSRAGETALLLSRAAEIVPAAASYPLLETWACLTAASPDGLPLLGETSVPGLFLAAGEGRDGVLLAPAVAALLADILTGQIPPLPPAPFSPARFGL